MQIPIKRAMERVPGGMLVPPLTTWTARRFGVQASPLPAAR